MELDSYQKYSVNHNGSLATDAKAGSGKTLCMLNKIKKLLDDGTAPSKITFCSFTKESAMDIQRRVAKAVGTDIANRLKSGTLHSLAYRIWTSNMKSTDTYFKPKLINDGFKYIQVNKIIKDFKLSALSNPIKFYNYLNYWYAHSLSPEAVIYLSKGSYTTNSYTYSERNAAIKCYIEYTKFLKKNSMFDFGSLLVWTNQFLKDEKIRLREARKVEHILVDECFIASAGILLADFDKMAIGDLYDMYRLNIKLPYIRTFNKHTGRIETKKIRQIIRTRNKNKLLRIKLSGYGSLPKCTRNHPIRTSNGWVEAGDLKAGDKIVVLKSNTASSSVSLIEPLHYEVVLATYFSHGDLLHNNGYVRVRYRENTFERAAVYNWKKTLIKFSGTSFFRAEKHKLSYSRCDSERLKLDHSFDTCIKYLSPRCLAIILCDNMMPEDDTYIINCTYVRNREYIDILMSELLRKFKIESKLLNKIIVIDDPKSVSIVTNLISNHVPETLAYKFNQYDYEKFPYIPPLLKYRYLDVQVVKSVEEVSGVPKYVYNLDVQDNHNYFVSRYLDSTTCTLVHNCHDINYAQFKMVEALSSIHKNIYVYFDYMQNIYSFIYSSNTELRNFINRNNIPVFSMPNNYRSKKNIVELGNKLIKASNDKELAFAKSTKDEIGNINIVINSSPEAEAIDVFDYIESKLDKYKYEDISIIYRTNAQSRYLVDEAINRGIPITVPSDSSFYNRKEVKELMSYIRILSSPFKAKYASFKNISNKPNRYISNKVLETINEYAVRHDVSFFRAMKNCGSIDIQDNQINNIYNFVGQIDQFINSGKTSSTDIINYVFNNLGYKKYILSNTNDETITEDTLDAMIQLVSDYENPRKLINHFKSLNKNEQIKNSVKFYTIHRSKGLTIPVVIFAGVSEGLIPHRKSNTPEGISEERRMAYVAVTRASDDILISTISGKYGRYNVTPSRFLYEMDLKIPKLTNCT